ncbi:hypothetical protein PFAG_05004 [Plasmodium falciparum Santa Lucia]|uniref:Nuclear speckle splicing regulatory protein 1 N-terminal domain-containing protein n=12 Tax=Plasmodium falciparum TaxID=5833 RepID=A0A5K1K8X0_PLAF7|nr:conserved Plasmodium protein, unknown function [Plasmodium falciparum 3D7]ETW29340.1 hypothetical protein PFFCH_03223 [Plasmodium falciparum FCH/4]ETW59218.1 hypothetical protein PFMC_04896 [Plasmodium falciparum CAMP/Malaysia]EUR65356.1 hypothetical protein PFBG_04970 [Plasmodium falciparum 7G8]EUT80363.1 hypothetical protein PFAG_05004 [Plasmodium falciparum Santa Lucia]EWC74296.1 hypothetical protein C923_05031 [Plasmodium falciparum UGT5.1]EWC86575.1 hypothetical protein PFNF54_04591 [|eukprot:XP_001350361.1 conserved Plasmodium protein, unknown function [Plasmodium falciparum 3D7]
MKINLSFNKNKENKNRNKNGDTDIDNDTRNNKSYKENNPMTRNKIETIFSMSDDEETINYENTHNKIIQQKKENQLNDKIKEYIKEHEEPALTTHEKKEDKKERIDEKNNKKKIQYLGYKSNELTKLNNPKTDDSYDYPFEEKEIYDNLDEKERKKKTIEHNDKDGHEYYKKDHKNHKKYTRSHENDNEVNAYNKDCDVRNKTIDKKTYMKKYDKNIQDYEKKKKKSENSDDDVNRSYLCIDDIFKKKENIDGKKKSKYMEALINSAKRRELEKEFLIQKKQKIDTEKEEKVFVTSAYKKKLMDRELIKKDMDLEVEEKKVDKSSNYNLNLFLKNINAPSNYNRYNRR